jgi:hypothetical protein
VKAAAGCTQSKFHENRHPRGKPANLKSPLPPPQFALKREFDTGGISHQFLGMEPAASKRSKGKQDVTVIMDYDVAADAKNRISLRGANAKYFHVLALSNGSYMLEPRVLVPPDALPARTLKMLNRSVANLKKGQVSPPIDLASYQKD